ncbi:hypothetical protein ZWY2020_040733 [Hordeum vulgare]|nr:hypothetical protein ZWY2020_040733 [Hordeum vulgare]
MRRSSSYTYHGDGYCDAPNFDLGLDVVTEPIAAAQTGEANLVVVALLFSYSNDWNGKLLSNYDPKDVCNIREKLAYDWVTSVHNSAHWKKLLRYEKE